MPKLELGSIKFEDGDHWHGGAGEGRCNKEKVRTQLITAYGQKEWNKFEKGKFGKKGSNHNFDFFFHKDGEIYVKPHGERKGGTPTGIKWKDVPIMKK